MRVGTELIPTNHLSARIVIVQTTNIAAKGDLMKDTNNSLVQKKSIGKHYLNGPRFRRKINRTKFQECIRKQQMPNGLNESESQRLETPVGNRGL